MGRLIKIVFFVAVVIAFWALLIVLMFGGCVGRCA